MADMGESAFQGNSSSKVSDMREWVSHHKLQTVGALWASGIVGSLAYNFRKPGERMSVKLIHARLHAQAFTLAALLAAAGFEYYENHQRSANTFKLYEKHTH